MRLSTDPARARHTTRMLGAAALCALGVGLAGCGGSSTRSTAGQASQTTTQAARVTPAQSNADTGGAVVQTRHRATSSTHRHGATASQEAAAGPAASQTKTKAQSRTHDATAVHTGAPPVQTARSTPASNDDNQSTGASGPPNPCRLVSLSQAQAITGGAVTSRIEAPLGPTCIYKSNGSHAGVITLAVESMSFSAATRHMTKRQSVVIHSRQAYCGRLGSQLLVVRLGGTQLLNVTAPCGIAQRFATLALSRLSA
jgi:hypothetical protein